VRAVLGSGTPAYDLAVWHGITVPFFMSLAALAGGAALYLLLRRYLARGVDGAPLLPDIDARRAFDALLVAIAWRWARALNAWLGTRRLQPQLRLLVIVACIAALWPVYRRGLAPGAAAVSTLDVPFALLWAVGIACALGAAWQAKFHRLAALMLTGGAGLVTCVTFVWFSAPDLALTQLLVEIVTTVLLLLGLRWLPRRIPSAWTWAAAPRRLVDAALAAASGFTLAALSYAVMTRALPDTISDFFVMRAYPEGGGTNVVNVILVDFRGFDTMGEITVLGAVAITVYGLLRRFRPARESLAPLRPQHAVQGSPADDLLVPSVLMRLMFGVIGVLSMYLLFRGHNLPGGGFVAGLTMSVAIILQYMAAGTRWTEDRLHIQPVRWIGIGLLLAAGTGACAWLYGRPFLTSGIAHVTLPAIGEVHLPSAFAFDLGVYSLVVGATVLILIALAHQSIRSHRPPRQP
jgi:multicomponent K+:H+ antiporter subunit A